jgi:quercetin dioxygenase-like cupin family protein
MFRNAIKAAMILGILTQSWVLLAQQPQQAATPAAGPTVTRTVLNQQDVAIPGYASALVRVDLPVGAREGKHQHPGTLIATVLEGVLTLDYEGKPTTQYRVGDTFSVEPGKVHEGINRGTVPVRLIASFVFPKDKPMTIQVP